MNLDVNNLSENKLEVTYDNISKNKISGFILEKFSANIKKIRLFNFFGIEILDDSDLLTFYSEVIRHKVIFFTRNNENFDYSKVMRMFKLMKKLGEVLFINLNFFLFFNWKINIFFPYII